MYSMSDMKHDAVVNSGIPILRRHDLPAELIPPDSQVSNCLFPPMSRNDSLHSLMIFFVGREGRDPGEDQCWLLLKQRNCHSRGSYKDSRKSLGRFGALESQLRCQESSHCVSWFKWWQRARVRVRRASTRN
jgi:hypothetical protein